MHRRRIGCERSDIQSVLLAVFASSLVVFISCSEIDRLLLGVLLIYFVIAPSTCITISTMDSMVHEDDEGLWDGTLALRLRFLAMWVVLGKEFTARIAHRWKLTDARRAVSRLARRLPFAIHVCAARRACLIREPLIAPTACSSVLLILRSVSYMNIRCFLLLGITYTASRSLACALPILPYYYSHPTIIYIPRTSPPSEPGNIAAPQSGGATATAAILLREQSVPRHTRPWKSCGALVESFTMPQRQPGAIPKHDNEYGEKNSVIAIIIRGRSSSTRMQHQQQQQQSTISTRIWTSLVYQKKTPCCRITLPLRNSIAATTHDNSNRAAAATTATRKRLYLSATLSLSTRK